MNLGLRNVRIQVMRRIKSIGNGYLHEREKICINYFTGIGVQADFQPVFQDASAQCDLTNPWPPH